MAVSQRKKSSDIIRLWQNLNNTEEIDYPAIIRWAIGQRYYDKKPPTLEEGSGAGGRDGAQGSTNFSLS